MIRQPWQSGDDGGDSVPEARAAGTEGYALALEMASAKLRHPSAQGRDYTPPEVSQIASKGQVDIEDFLKQL